MSRATVDLQSVRFFLGYGLIFFFQHVFTVVGVTILVFVDLVAARADRARRSRRAGRDRLPLQPRLASRPPRRAAEDGRRRDGRRGEHRRRPRRQVVRAGAGRAGQVRAALRSAVPPERSREPAAGVLRAGARVPAAARPGGGAARRRPHGRERLADAGRLRLVQPLPGDARLPAAHARDVDRRGAARDRLGRADLRGDRRARGHPRRAGARELPAGAGHVRFEGVTFGYDPERPVLRRARPRARAGQDGRADRPHRQWQDDARVAHPALLRRAGRPRHDRRRRRARGDAQLAAARDRRDRAGSVPLLGDRPREHRVRPAGRDRRGGRARGAARAGARVHRAAARRATTR